VPDFTVIKGGGPEGRDRIRVEQEFELALREAGRSEMYDGVNGVFDARRKAKQKAKEYWDPRQKAPKVKTARKNRKRRRVASGPLPIEPSDH
jgi:hypothetical protein